MANTHFTKQYNKIVIAGDVLMDLSGDTVAASSMLSGVTAHDKNGAAITGNIATKTSSNVTIATTGANAGKVTVDAGYYATAVTKAMTNASISLSDPSITANPTITKETASGTNQGKIKAVASGSGTSTATVNTAGFVSSISDTGNVTVSGTTYTTAESIESTLIASNVKTGVKIFQTTGTFTADATATAGEILYGETAYVSGSKVTGSMPKFDDDTTDHVTISTLADVAIPAGYYDGSVKAGIDATSAAQLVPANIEILGVTGSLDPASEVTVGPVTATPKFTSQTILPSSISKQFINQVTVNAISYTETQTTSTTGYTFTISNVF